MDGHAPGYQGTVIADIPSRGRLLSFGGLGISYDERVIEPRPWTILQSLWAADLSNRSPDGTMLELCCGAGHIGLLAAARTGRRLVQVDANPAACELARRNAAAAGLADQVEVREGRLLDVVAADESFAIVIADPPYLRTDAITAFPEDPELAIDGGADGLAVVRDCLEVVERASVDGTPTLLQVRGRTQADDVAALLPPHRAIVEIREDGPERAVLLLREIDPATGRLVRSAPSPDGHDQGRRG
jgi:methylase of polypeptide subunit release factors